MWKPHIGFMGSDEAVLVRPLPGRALQGDVPRGMVSPPWLQKNGCLVQNLHFLSKTLVLFAKAGQFNRIRLLTAFGFC